MTEVYNDELSLGTISKNSVLSLVNVKIDEFTGDGSTTAFTLTATAGSTTYEVFIAGREQTSGITKTTSGFTFSSAPKNGAIVEARYNANTDAFAWLAEFTFYTPSGTQVTINAPTTITVQENADFAESTDKQGNTERRLRSRDYTINLDLSLVEDAQSFYDAWKDKKFRLILENTNGSNYKKDIAAVCHIESYSKDYLGYIQGVTIRATDYYEDVS